MSMGGYVSRIIPHPPIHEGDCCTSTWVWAFVTARAKVNVSGEVGVDGAKGSLDVAITGLGAGGAETLHDCCKQ